MKDALSLLDALEYRGEAQLVGLYLVGDRDGEALVMIDAESKEIINDPTLFLDTMHQMGECPQGVTLGNRFVEATHWIVVDRNKNQWSLVPAPIARNIVTGRPIKLSDIPRPRDFNERYDLSERFDLCPRCLAPTGIKKAKFGTSIRCRKCGNRWTRVKAPKVR